MGRCSCLVRGVTINEARGPPEELEIENNQEEVYDATLEPQLDVGWSMFCVCSVVFLVEYACGVYCSRSRLPEPVRAVQRRIQ